MAHSAPKPQRVGVIGGGAAGIISAKTLRDIGHDVVVFEKSVYIGGIWKYDESADAPSSVVYKSLHTNLPTAIMQLADLSFPDDTPSFPSHAAIHKYLETYARHFGVSSLVRLNSTVTGAEKVGGRWRLHASSADDGEYEEDFDRLVVASGHFSKPQYVSIKGIEHFPGRVTHSRSYRTPDVYIGKRVLLIGRGPSGQDISLELAAGGAKEVLVAALDFDPNCAADKRDQRVIKPAVDHIADDGSVVFADGSSVTAPDEIIHCTGYLYTSHRFLPSDLLFPEAQGTAETGQLDSETVAALRDSAANELVVAPLHKHVFAVEDPTVSFVGLAIGNLPFLCFELQARWVARVFADVASLPPKSEMYSDLVEIAKNLDGELRYLHKTEQRTYFAEIAALSGAKVDESIYEIYGDAAFLRTNFPHEYRSAEYRRGAKSGKWERRLLPNGELRELVKEFSS